MNYLSHNLRIDLQEWKNRLYRANYIQFEHEFKYLMDKFENNKQISTLLNDATNKYKYTDQEVDDLATQLERNRRIAFENQINQASFCYKLLQCLIKQAGNYDLTNFMLFATRDFEQTRNKIIEGYISPIIYYLHDELDKSNSTIFLLEKYKRRTEWFTKGQLYQKYTSSDKNYEQIFEDDLRLFLFDQGIDYPFSTPLSSSGRADIIGEIETDNPLIIEIKILDKNKKYGKNRIKDGFTQILKYANDYNKDVGYLILFNMDDLEFNLSFNESNKTFPPCIHFNNKTFYFIIVNCNIGPSASKLGTTNKIVVTEDELTNSN